jgi:HAD superfamily hydrolase (TIGR01509 family)
MPAKKLIIFDCDGVVVDSEPLTTAVICEMTSELGLTLEPKEVLERFNGRKVEAWVAELEAMVERPIAEDFIPEFRRRSAEKFRAEITPVPGIRSLLEDLTIPFCLASSGPPSKIRLTLGLTNLLDFFEGKIFSGYEIGCWKPDPGLFLHAASSMGAAAADCVVIEDSRAGVQAGLAAGMTVFHYSPLAESGEDDATGVFTFKSMDEVQDLLKRG